MTNSLSPYHQLECLHSKDGFVKIKLYYTTEEPKHVNSYVLSHTYGFKGPFREDVCILMPQQQTTPELDCFFPKFCLLKFLSVISKTSELRNFTILEEDEVTLSYVLD